ncbi:related to IMP1 Protease, mitochondrial [Fusarium fujikuroi]|uniref:Related to IMP1 Protease, mitochondrial n=3 Tax=Fusarium fujikuroi species complex TaxID=171627 RepID=S0E7X4_GIBF5|nr:related to IMP1 Protease, mitochondrial [Fusarium fujikuroi IMI 58289]XP_031081414.1 uncharacterized protein FPRO_10409 [Fusarium proliferatum ET1]KAG4262017.1 hypothetical protein FPRO03_10890 [Fusarium proliferatum]KAI1051587.1 hypothetical protein LB506_003014 [Fusarium annulatum]KLO88031.1 IMP1 Protease, mitochondrial [Fusarium fujikuroi]KAG4277287.1 hypothetical protein FPRO04_07584 [Fusarium proliferatum]KAG4283120.1 hypothetical protein FPRO06_09793 [Fusarium proliferatum]
MASFHFARRPVQTTVSFLKAACLVHLGITYGYTISPAQGPSMLPTFTVDGDWILCDHTRRYGRGVSVGDLVVYRIPIFNNQWGVKRVTGMPGDYVSVGTPGEQGEELMIQIPEGHCWISGDNLPASRDSRHFGPLPLALISGTTIAKILPWNERQWMKNGLQKVEELD